MPQFRRVLVSLLLGCLVGAGPGIAPGPATAEMAAEAQAPRISIAEFGTVLQFDILFDVLREEGIAQAAELATNVLPNGAGQGWDQTVERIYDMGRIRARFNHALRARLGADPALSAEAMTFFASGLGQRVTLLEIEARRAFLDIAQEEAARVAADSPETARDPKWRLIQRLIVAGDLLEANVAAGLSGSLGFMLGLQEAGVSDRMLPVEDLAADAWGQEEMIRSEVGIWLKAYLGLAYSPLSEDELEAYVVFLESPAGRHYSGAIEFAFAEAFRPVSRALGRAAGTALQSQDI